MKLYLLKQAGHLWCSLGLHSRRHALGMYSTVLLNQGLALGFFPTQGFSNHLLTKQNGHVRGNFPPKGYYVYPVEKETNSFYKSILFMETWNYKCFCKVLRRTPAPSPEEVFTKLIIFCSSLSTCSYLNTLCPDTVKI